MQSDQHIYRKGATSLLVILVITSIAFLLTLFAVLLWISKSPEISLKGESEASSNPLTVLCAAGLRYPLDKIVDSYTATYGRPIRIQYGGSNTMLSQLSVGKNADLYIAADESYTELAQRRKMVRERLPLATQRPVIIINGKIKNNVSNVSDLYRNNLRYAIGDPQATAVGKKTKQLLSPANQWEPLQSDATVIKPTVNEIASAVSLGTIDAGIVWDSTAEQYPDLIVVRDSILESDPATIEAAVTEFTEVPAAALHFGRYLAASDRGLQVFSDHGFNIVNGDAWAEKPQITFYVGAVNRRAVENAVNEFAAREGVTVNTVYNGCGILTAQMRALHKNKALDFPDSFMACDTFYMDTVDDLFLDSVNISDTDIVLVVKKGNPKSIRNLTSLIEPGIRVALGQPRQCTIGVLSKNLLVAANLYKTLRQSGNIVTETTSSALLLPNIISGAADATLAYRADANAVATQVEIIPIESSIAKAVQPFGISKQSDAKQLSSRLFESISNAKADFLKHGFGWQLPEGSRPSILDTSPTINTPSKPLGTSQ